MSIFGLGGPSADILFSLQNEDKRPKIEAKVAKDKHELVPIYFDGESVIGKVVIRPRDGRRFEHYGIKIEFIGDIEFTNEKGNHNEFLSLGQELSSPGELRDVAKFDFEFRNVEKPYESFTGSTVRLRYFIKLTISKRLSALVTEKTIWVYSYKIPPEINSSIKMEVGIEDCLHIEFEYNKSKYHLRDIVVGKIYFILIRLKIKSMELSIVRRETIGTGTHQINENETVSKYEIMDGAPGKGEVIPIRLFLNGFDLSPTFRDVNKKFSIRYYLNLVLVDEDNRRYFKQQEITLFRRREDDLALLGSFISESSTAPIMSQQVSLVSSPSSSSHAARSVSPSSGSGSPILAMNPKLLQMPFSS